MDFNGYLTIISFVIAILLLILRMKTKEKKHFLISMGFILIGSLINYISYPGTILLFFLLAALSSFIGDLLMARVISITDNRTIDGGLVFGIAHILYITAFSSLRSQTPSWWIYISIVLSLILYMIFGYNPKHSTPRKGFNYIYAALITYMATTVLTFAIYEGVTLLTATVALTGALFFMISDGVLTYNEFKKPVNNAKDIIAVTYIVAQVLLQLTPLVILLSY